VRAFQGAYDGACMGGSEAPELAALRRRVAELERELATSRSAEAFLQSVLKAVPNFITNVDPDLNIRFLNRYLPEYDPASVVGRSVLDYVDPKDHALVREQIDYARATGEITSFSVDGEGVKGQRASYMTWVAAVHEPDGRVGACLSFVDVTEQRARDKAYRESQERLRLALDATGIGLWSWDPQTDEPVWDARLLELHGLSEMPPLDAYFTRIVHPDDRERLRSGMRRAARVGELAQATYRIIRPDGSVRWLFAFGRLQTSTEGRPLMMGGCTDVTRQHELEEQLKQAQKMEAVGSLTAGIAHNFNNMLAVIIPTLELAEQLVPAQHLTLIQHASHAATRASELVLELMTYAGQSAATRRVNADLKRVVEAAADICRRTFDAHIALRVEYATPPPVLACSPVQIEQVLVNLLLNARDAVLDANVPHGSVTLRVRRARPSDTPGAVDPDGAVVCIDVIDNGAGMSEEVRARIFEPFFTTKGVGRGTGLGLATSYAIVREHGGAISAESEVGRGSCFTVELPITRTEEQAPQATPVTTDTPLKASVLVVDDDVAVRDTLVHVLSAAGLEVLQAYDGESAVAALAARPSIDVVLLDRSMPGGPGERFVPRLRAVSPHAKLVFLSGQAIHPALAQQVDFVLPKPTTGGALLSAIRDVLRAR
jgi:two-component system cell cycle sensor histidine kinase/response regulator CckA